MKKLTKEQDAQAIEDILEMMAVCDVVNIRRMADAYGADGNKLLKILIQALKQLRKEDAVTTLDESWLQDED